MARGLEGCLKPYSTSYHRPSLPRTAWRASCPQWGFAPRPRHSGRVHQRRPAAPRPRNPRGKNSTFLWSSTGRGASLICLSLHGTSGHLAPPPPLDGETRWSCSAIARAFRSARSGSEMRGRGEVSRRGGRRWPRIGDRRTRGCACQTLRTRRHEQRDGQHRALALDVDSAPCPTRGRSCRS